MLLQRIAYVALILTVAGMIGEQVYLYEQHKPSEKPVIRIACASWQKGELPFEAFIEAYHYLHPEVRLELKIMPPQSENKLIMLWLKGRTPYDIVIAYADEEIHTFIEMGVLEDVQNLLTPEELDEFLPASMAGSSVVGYDGKLHRYMIPFTVEMMCLNVRQDLLRKRGIETLPKTYDELYQIARRLKGLRSGPREVWPIAADFGQGIFFGQNFYIPMLADFTDGKITDEQGRLDIKSDAAAKVFETLRRWYEEGLVSPASTIPGQADRDFKGGLAVIYPHWQSRGQFVMRQFAGNPEIQVAIYPAPGAERAGSLVSCYGAFIPIACPNKRLAAKVAFELLSHWIQPAVAASGKMPPIKSVYDHGFDKNPPWLEKIRQDFANVPRKDWPLWLRQIEQVYASAEMPDWMRRLRPSLLKGYSFPDVTMWGKVAPFLAITFQEWLRGDYGDDVRAALAKLQERVELEYRRVAHIRNAIEARRRAREMAQAK